MERKISLPLMRRDAQVMPVEDAAAETVDVIWTTGAVVRRRAYSWEDGMKEYDEELVVTPKAVRLDRLNGGAPFLNTHGDYDLGDQIGVVVEGSARIAGGKGYATVKLSLAAEHAGLVQNIRGGIIRNISVGYKTHAVEEREREGQIPLVRVIDWEPWEISAVPVPADPGAKVRAEEERLFECVVHRDGPSNAVRLTRMRMMHRRLGLSR